MPSRQDALRLLKTLTFVLIGMTVTLGIAALLRGETAVPIKGVVVEQPQKEPDFRRYRTEEVTVGLTMPADTHIIFTVPSNINAIDRITFFGGPELDAQRYWGYCYKGDELRQADGRTTYHPDRFFYSTGERIASNIASASTLRSDDPLAVLEYLRSGEPQKIESLREVFRGGETCYLMTSVSLAAGPDYDGDYLNTKMESLSGTDPNNPDTDFDEMQDAHEIFVTHTSAVSADTDADGLSDSCEDENRNGRLDPEDTSPLRWDTDNDGLCDGDGNAPGCHEEKFMNIVKTDFCDPKVPYSECAVLGPAVRGEDKNRNCKFDAGETDPRNPETYTIDGVGMSDWQYWFNKVGAPGNGRRVP